MSKKKKRQEAVCDIDQDGNFAFIAGYTPGGFPYGITWEEQAEIDRRERKGQLADEGPDNPDFSFEAARNHSDPCLGVCDHQEEGVTSTV